MTLHLSLDQGIKYFEGKHLSMEFIFPCFDLCFFAENRGEENKKPPVFDDPFLLEHFRNLFKRRSFFDRNDFGGCCVRGGDKEKPTENDNKEEKEKPRRKEQESTPKRVRHGLFSWFGLSILEG